MITEYPWRRFLILGLLVAIGGLFLISMMSGRADLPWSALFDPEQQTAQLILWELRLPRTLLGLAVGAALGLSGAVLQGFLRNPLADAGLIGVSSGAAFGAVLTLYSGLAAWFALALPLGGLAGAAAAVTLVYALAGRDSSILTLILAGVAINSFTAALTSLALNFAPNPYAVMEIIFWLLGSLSERSMEHVHLATPLIFAGIALLSLTGRGLDALSLGEDTAHTLGVSLTRLRLLVLAGTAMAVGSAVAVTGAVGFIGLVIPHLLRPLCGYRPSQLLLPSALGGAALLLAADIAVRRIPTNVELKLGVVTALIGAPFFLYLLIKTRREQP